MTCTSDMLLNLLFHLHMGRNNWLLTMLTSLPLFVSAVPSAPNLELEPFNCTSITVRWHPAPGDAVVQGYKLSWHPDGKSESSTIQLCPQDYQHTIAALGECFRSYRDATDAYYILLPN